MANIRVNCPQCNTVLECPQELAGQNCRCSVCDREFPVPAAGLMPATPYLAASPYGRPPHSHLAYILLAFFLGGLGIHNFYIGKTGRGVAQLLITVLSFGLLSPIVTIWVAIELFTVKEDAEGRMLYPPYRGVAVALGVVDLVGLLLIPVILAAMLLPALGAARERAREVRCINNLKQAGLALFMYAADHDEYLPASADGDWQKAVRHYLGNGDTVFVCPLNDAPDGGYVYLGSGLNLTEFFNAGEVPILMDRLGNHRRKRISVVFLDGHVESREPGVTYAETVRLLSDGRAPEAVVRNAEALDRQRR